MIRDFESDPASDRTSPEERDPAPGMSTVEALGFRVFAGSASELIEVLNTATDSCTRARRFGYLNAAQFNRAWEDQDFRGLLHSMDTLYVDGRSIEWAARLCGVELPERLTAADFIEDALAQFSSSGRSLGLLGGSPQSLTAFASHWKRRLPQLEIRYQRDGYFDAIETTKILKDIESADPHIVLVGMGAPLQERFVDEAIKSGGPRIWWCVGGLFEYGPWGKTRAPVWMQRCGLEWLFRLIQEPRRLAHRYLIGNPLFVWRALRSRGRGFDD